MTHLPPSHYGGLARLSEAPARVIWLDLGTTRGPELCRLILALVPGEPVCLLVQDLRTGVVWSAEGDTHNQLQLETTRLHTPALLYFARELFRERPAEAFNQAHKAVLLRDGSISPRRIRQEVFSLAVEEAIARLTAVGILNADQPPLDDLRHLMDVLGPMTTEQPDIRDYVRGLGELETHWVMWDQTPIAERDLYEVLQAIADGITLAFMYNLEL